MMTLRLTGIAALAAFSLVAQYKAEPAGAAPPEVSGVAGALVKDGLKILKPDGAVLCEIWLVAAEPGGGTTARSSTTPTECSPAAAEFQSSSAGALRDATCCPFKYATNPSS